MKVGLYFGSFNPIHTGHCIIAQFVADNTSVNQVWLIVTPQNPLKPAKGLLNEYDRLNLVRKAIEGSEKLKASDIEFHLPRPSYTIDTLTYLEEKFPQHQFSIIMGSDSLLNIHKWKNAEQLIKRFPLIIYPRPGAAIEETGYPLQIIKAPMLDISATTIRSMIKEGKNIRYMVPDAVQDEIIKSGYYL